MLVFPQLSTGALVQFPFEVHRLRRTLVNECADGTLIRYPEPNSGQIRWRLRYTGLTDSELQSIESLFTEVQGRLKTFLFIDPSANMLASSEVLGATVWDCDPMMRVTALDARGPVSGRVHELCNTGQADQDLSQSAAAPADYSYTFSFFAKSDACIQLNAGAVAGTSMIWREYSIRPEWRRYVLSSANLSTGDGIRFSLRLGAGATLRVCGLQLEAQPGPSDYRPSTSAGVYRNARFGKDEFRVITNGLNDHSVDLEVVSQVEP